VDVLETVAPVFVTWTPVSREPVSEISGTSGCSTSAFPPSPPPPWTMLTTPGGTSASTSNSTKRSPSVGVSVAGLKTTVLPHTSAGRIFQLGIAIGKFHGVITPTTPIGCRTLMLNLSRSSDGVV